MIVELPQDLLPVRWWGWRIMITITIMAQVLEIH